jgi:hypothetical protein
MGDRDDAHAGAEVVDESAAGGRPVRLALEWLREESDGAQSWIVVGIAGASRSSTGQSPPVARKRRRHGVHRAVLATIDAIEAFTGRSVSCALLDIGRARAGDETAITVRLQLADAGRAAEVLGRARVREGAASAAALATLDAANTYFQHVASPGA